MRIYQAITTGHLISAILMQMEYKERAILVSPIWIEMKYPQYKILEELFEKVIILRTGYRNSHTKEETAQYFRENLPEIDDSEIIVWGAQSGLGIFCAEEHIPFTFCEEGTGFLSRVNVLSHHDAKNPDLAETYQFLQNLGLYDGSCSAAVCLLGNMSVQVDGYQYPEGKELIDFSISRSLFKLCEAEREWVIKFFVKGVKYPIKENSVVLFTQHFANLYAMTLEEQILLYQLMVDYYFTDKNLIIKPHPDDLLYYSELFCDALVMRERFPSEFIPYLCTPAPSCYASVYSSAVYNLADTGAEIFELNIDFENDFKYINKYYIALKIALHLGKKIYAVGLNGSMLEHLMRLEETKSELTVKTCKTLDDNVSEDCTIIIDEAEVPDGFEKNLKDTTTLIFLNTKLDYGWEKFAYDLWDYIMPVLIKKEKRSDVNDMNFQSDLYEEVLYVYSKKETTRLEVNAMSIKKELPHVGIDLMKIPVSDKEEKILLLEGMLNSSEQSLLFYKNRVRELEIENERLRTNK